MSAIVASDILLAQHFFMTINVLFATLDEISCNDNRHCSKVEIYMQAMFVVLAGVFYLNRNYNL